MEAYAHLLHMEQIKSTWLIKQNGILNTDVDKDLKLVTEDSPVAVVSVIGSQSSGKSTLSNYLFGTDFKEMDAQKGRFQTTKGNWVAKKPLPRGCLLVIDTEGRDGSEKQDDDKFEKKTALFALAVSDIIVVNMWCIDIGRYQAAGWPLLMTVIEVMMRICDQRKATLLFVLRDKTQTPLEILKEQIMEELLKMWKELIKPQDKLYAKLEDYFQIEVVGMPSLIFQKQEFSVEAAALKERIVSLSKSRNGRIAASGFADYAKRIWDLIRDDKDLDLPKQRAIVAEIKCNQIAKDNYTNFCENESWGQLKKRVYSKGTVQGFGKTVNSLIQNSLSGYDKEALYFDGTVRDERRKQLIQELLQIIEPIHWTVVQCMGHVSLKNFKKSVDLEEEYVNKGKDLQQADVIQDYIPRFQTELYKHLADASIEYTDWDRSTFLCEIIEDEAKSYLCEEKKSVLYKLEIMAAKGQCNKIAAENYKDFCENKLWIEVKNSVCSDGTIKGFGKTVNSLVRNCLSRYDRETSRFDDMVRNDRRNQLMDELLEVVQPVHRSLVEGLSHEELENFKKLINLEEYIKDGKDLRQVKFTEVHIHAFLAELDKQLADARIECANWDHSTKLRETKEHEAKAYLEHEMDMLLSKVQTMIAQVQCTQIAEKNYNNFCQNESWTRVEREVCSKSMVKNFGEQVNLLIQKCIAEYNKEVRNFDELVADEIRLQLFDQLLQVVEPIHKSLVEYMCQVALENFQKSINLEKELVEHWDGDLPEVLKAHIYKMLNEIDLHFADASIIHATWDHPDELLHFYIDQAKAYLETENNKLVVKLEKGDSKLLWKIAGSRVKIAGQNVKNRVSTFFSRFYSFISMWLEQKVTAAASAIHSGLAKLYLTSFEKYSTKRINQR